MKKIAYFMSIIIVSMSSLTAFATWPANKPLRLAVVQEWSHLNPVTSQLASNEALMPFILRQMVLRTSSGSVQPDLAVSVPTLKGSKATWIIRPEAKWGDGQLITCKDWDLGWKVGLSENVVVNTRTVFTKIKSITWSADKPQECQVEYAQKDWSYDRDLPPLLPSHVEDKTFQTHKDKAQAYERNSNYVLFPNLAGLYNGPYIITEFKLGSHILLSRNKHFYGQEPEIEKIVIRHIPDTGTLKSHLLSGEIDGISAVGFPPDTALQFDEEFSKDNKYKVHFQNSAIFQGLFFNHDNDILKEKVVREAITRSIDKEAIVKAFFGGKLRAAYGILPPQHPSFRAYNSTYSKKSAIEMLDKAGWKLNKRGVRERDGKTLSFIFKTSAGIKVLENIQVYMCNELKEIGVECVIKNEAPRTLLGSSVPQGEYHLTMYGQPIPPDTTITSYFASSEIPTNANSWAGGNGQRIRSLNLDKMLKQFDNEPSLGKRNQLIQKIEDYFRSEFLLVPLYHRREAIVLPAQLEQVKDSFEGTAFFQPENWTTKKPAPKKVEKPKTNVTSKKAPTETAEPAATDSAPASAPTEGSTNN